MLLEQLVTVSAEDEVTLAGSTTIPKTASQPKPPRTFRGAAHELGVRLLPEMQDRLERGPRSGLPGGNAEDVWREIGCVLHLRSATGPVWNVVRKGQQR